MKNFSENKGITTIAFIVIIVLILSTFSIIVHYVKFDNGVKSESEIEIKASFYRLKEDKLKTLQDSIHYYEDGF